MSVKQPDVGLLINSTIVASHLLYLPMHFHLVSANYLSQICVFTVELTSNACGVEVDRFLKKLGGSG